MKPVTIVAGKEFRDHVTSKRFLVIFAILLLVSIYAVASGMAQYNQNLDDYKKNAQQNQQQQWYKDQVAAYQKQIQEALDRTAPREEIDMLQQQLGFFVNPPMPSVLYIFGDMSRYFVLIGMVLSISMGFDLITREKEEGSLKSLLSHPVYRDSIINGKSLGAIGVLVVVMTATSLITIAIMLVFGMVPGLDDFLRIAAFFLLALLYCTVFFALAMMTSTLAKNSSMSVMYVLGIVIGLVMISMFSDQIVSFVMGPPPVYDGGGIDILPIRAGAESSVMMANDLNATISSGAAVDSNGSPAGYTKLADPVAPIDVNDESQRYWERQQMLTDAINSISPMSSFGDRIAPALFSNQAIMYSSVSSMKMAGYYGSNATVWDSLASVWINVLVLVIEIILAFAVSYVTFLRADVR